MNLFLPQQQDLPTDTLFIIQLIYFFVSFMRWNPTLKIIPVSGNQQPFWHTLNSLLVSFSCSVGRKDSRMILPLALLLKAELKCVLEMSQIFLTTTALVPKESWSLNSIIFHQSEPCSTLGYFFKKPFSSLAMMLTVIVSKLSHLIQINFKILMYQIIRALFYLLSYPNHFNVTSNKYKKMGKTLRMYIEITDMNTGAKFTQALSSPLVTYQIVLDIIQSYCPEIDTEALTVYYYKYNKWRLFVEEDKEDLEYFSHCFEVDKESNHIVMQVRYHCEYFLENQQEEIIREDLTNMSERVEVVQKLYQQLREKYMQDALDINVFWASPLWTKDKISRSRKGIQSFENLQGQKVQLLNNQLKATPYVNALVSALQNCDKKVHLFLKPFNADSFTRKSVFTVTYIMSHLQVEEIKSKNKTQRNRDYSKTIHSKGTNNEQQEMNSIRRSDRTGSHKDNERLLNPPKFIKQSSFKNEDSIELVIQEQQKPQLLKTKTSMNQSEIGRISKLEHSQSLMNQRQWKANRSTRMNQDNEEILQLQQDDYWQEEKISKEEQFKKHRDQQKRHPDKVRVGQKKDKPKINSYLLGEQIDGQLCKITPKKLAEMLEENKHMKDIELLILHTSYPYYHLEAFSKRAKNIILINSNPLYPEPSTVFFIKQFFTLLLKTGNIPEAYNEALAYTISLKRGPLEGLPQKQIQFINQTNEKYVHGTMQCCCCYHPHHDDCQSNGNNCPTKFAQYHYKFHTIHCECPRQNLMIHECEEKKKLMKKHFQVLDKGTDFKQYYFCCCNGFELGYYNKLKMNKYFNNVCLINEERDRHNITYKYRYEKKMVNEEENQLEIYPGKVEGDVGKSLLDAYLFRQQHSLIGNGSVTCNLLQLFTQDQTNHSVICNLHGSKRTGRKTIAIHFANLIVIKQVFQRIVMKNLTSVDSISGIVKRQLEKNKDEGNPFFIFAITQKRDSEPISLSESTFGEPIRAIVITQKKAVAIRSLNVTYLQPMPFRNDHCEAYVKMYKHLKRQDKRNLQTLFRLSSKGYDKAQLFQMYPRSLNQFQILSVLYKTQFHDYEMFQSSLAKLKRDNAHYYVFVMSLIKFTVSVGTGREEVLERIKKGLNKMESDQTLFFRDYGIIDKKMEDKAESEASSELTLPEQPTETEFYKSQLIELSHLKHHYHLIYACAGYKFKDKLKNILKLFINYSTLIPNHKINEEPKMKRQINYLRVKKSSFSQQPYEATTINSASYVSKYFKQEIQDIFKEFNINYDQSQDRREIRELQEFLKWHSKTLEHRRSSNRKSFQFHSKPKDKQKRVDLFGSSPLHQRESTEKASSACSAEHHEVPEESTDIQHTYHLAAVAQAGLQFIRAVIGTHFIYNRLKEDARIQFLKLSLLLVNNCVILLKNKTFASISGRFDLDEDYDEYSHRNITKRIFEQTHGLASPGLQTMKSQDIEFIPPPTNRTYSGRQLFNSTRTQQHRSSWEEGHRSAYEQSKAILLHQLYRLSTYKGILYLLSSMQKRCEEINKQSILHVKIGVQLIGIQVRLEQLQLEREQTSRLSFVQKDRYLAHISEVFSQKNYNMTALMRILRQERQSLEYDFQQLAIIKPHIIVALSLMSSCYGRYKLIRGDFTIEQIDSFLSDLSLQQYQRRQSQQEGPGLQREQLSRITEHHPFFAFMRLISQNESVYLHIVESFNSVQFVQQKKFGEELNIYMQLLRLFHLFSLKNTKTKLQFYNKLELIEQRLHDMKKHQNYYNLSTYIHHFRDTFVRSVKNQMNKLGEHLILLLTADSECNYNDIKMSLGQRLDELISRKSKENHSLSTYFCIKKKFSLATLQRLADGYRCHYLCLYVPTVKNDETRFCINNQDPKNIEAQNLAIELLSKAKYKVGFICIPKKKTLVQQLINKNPMKRIIYFDFTFDNFNYAQEKYINDRLIFEKMIMIKTVSGIMKEIIERQSRLSKTAVHESFCRVRNSYSFLFVDQQRNEELIKLRNKQFRKCLFMHGIEDSKFNQEYPEQTIILHQNLRIKNAHLAVIQKFTSRLSGKSEDVKIDLPGQKQQFLDIFTFYFKEKYGFNHIFRINLDDLKKIVPSTYKSKGNEDQYAYQLKKCFYERLIDNKTLEEIFSNKKVILMIEFRQFDKIAKANQKVLEDMMNDFFEEHTSRCRYKFTGYVRQDNKSTMQTIIYFFDNQEKQRFGYFSQFKR